MTPQIDFKDYLFNYFLEWEKKQPRKRSSFSAFARWLSQNSSNTKITQQVVDGWINGSKPREYKYVSVLAEKIGPEIYDVLGYESFDADLQRLSKIWQYIPEKIRQGFLQQGEQYVQGRKNDKKRPAKETT